MADEEDDETLIAAAMPGRPLDPRFAPAGHDDDAIPDEEATLLAIPRSAFPSQPHRMLAGMHAPPPRPAAGLPPATPPPPRPAAGLPPQAQPGFVPVLQTVQMTKLAPQVPAPTPQMPRVLPGPPPPPAGPPPVVITQPIVPPAPPPPVAAQPAVIVTPPPPPPLPPPAPLPVAPAEMAAPEGLPPIVVRWLLACGLLTVMGLLALIYLQL